MAEPQAATWATPPRGRTCHTTPTPGLSRGPSPGPPLPKPRSGPSVTPPPHPPPCSCPFRSPDQTLAGCPRAPESPGARGGKAGPSGLPSPCTPPSPVPQMACDSRNPAHLPTCCPPPAPRRHSVASPHSSPSASRVSEVSGVWSRCDSDFPGGLAPSLARRKPEVAFVNPHRARCQTPSHSHA